jgi:hypothetical protein
MYRGYTECHFAVVEMLHAGGAESALVMNGSPLWSPTDALGPSEGEQGQRQGQPDGDFPLHSAPNQAHKQHPMNGNASGKTHKS